MLGDRLCREPNALRGAELTYYEADQYTRYERYLNQRVGFAENDLQMF